MNHIQGRTNECLLATICMLADKTQKDYEVIGDYIVEQFGDDWLYRMHRDDFGSIKQIIKIISPKLDYNYFINYPLPDNEGTKLLVPKSKLGKLANKGWLYIKYDLSAHAVAFEKKYIYDPKLSSRCIADMWFHDEFKRKHILGFKKFSLNR